jgi:tetratricopeptide (TPR) repeat protein
MSAWRTVRVFLSSTFRDMDAERDHLVKVTFPALRERLLPHRVELYDVDLRWGITEDEARNSQVIPLCLEQVDQCRPFFLAFVGHRYGWVPTLVPEDARRKYPVVADFPNVSVTELEVRHGALNSPRASHALAMLRDDAALQGVPRDVLEMDFVEASAPARERLAKLRQELQHGPVPVKTYTAAWNPNRFNRSSRTAGRFVELDGFGRSVEDWLWEAIRTELRLPPEAPSIDALDAEADLHERFLEQRTRMYVGREDVYGQLRGFVLASDDRPLVLTGDSGIGKSAALARLVRSLRDDLPDIFVVPHFVGASPATSSLPRMLQRVTRELQRTFQLRLPEADSRDEMLRGFLNAIAILPASRKVALVFDGLNQLGTGSAAESLAWLPERLPPHVRVLVSFTTPAQPPRLLTAFDVRDHVKVVMAPLNEAERRQIIRAVPQLVAKTLDGQQVDRLLANPATRNPLFLTVALEELRGFGSFDHLNARIAALPAQGDAVTALFDQVFERLEQEFNQPLAAWTLRLLSCARSGLGGPELVELLSHLGDDAGDLYPLLRQIRPYLQLRDGLFDFYHASIRHAAEARYLGWSAGSSRPTESERTVRRHLLSFFRSRPLTPRSIGEIPFQLHRSADLPGLSEALSEPSFLAAAWASSKADTEFYWAEIDKWSHAAGAPDISLRGRYPAILESADQDGLVALGSLLNIQGDGRAAIRVFSRLLEGSSDSETRKVPLYHLAELGMFTDDRQLFTRSLEELEAIALVDDDPQLKHRVLGYNALLAIQVHDWFRAIDWLGRKLPLCEMLHDVAGEMMCHQNLALCHFYVRKYSRAQAHSREFIALARRQNDVRRVAEALNNLGLVERALEDFDSAMRDFEEAAVLSERQGWALNHAHALANQAITLVDFLHERHADALLLLRRAIDVAPDHLKGRLMDDERRVAAMVARRRPDG